MGRDLKGLRLLIGTALLVAVSFGLYMSGARPSPAADTSAELQKLQESAQIFAKLFNEVSEYVKPSVVHVKATKVLKTEEFERFHPPSGEFPFGDEFFDRFFRGRVPKEFRQQGFGSGVIVDERGYILTNNHVVEGADEIAVTLGEKKEFKATVIGADPPTDVAVIKIEAEKLPVAKLGNSDEIKIGDWAIAIGNPFGLTQTVTAGIISATGRANVGIADYEDFIQTDAAINPGNSGGPLVNLKGEVIGINTAIFTRTGGYQGIGFAIPVNMAKAVMNSLIAKGKVTRGWLGVAIQDVTEDLAKSFGLPGPKGVLVSDVTPNSPAERAGMQRGDVIMEYEGKEVKDVNHLRNMVAQTEVGKVANLNVLRNGSTKGLTVTIGEQPTGLFAAAGAEQPTKDLGMSLEDLTPELARRFGYEKEMGVVVTDVEPGSKAELSGIQPGDLIKEVNRERIHNLQEFREMTAKTPKEQGLLLLIKRGPLTRYVLIKP
ncbi:MAG TPA: DegQ family serine endoprotease [Candidatus Hypogeohydataceae bacterium YC38]